MKKEFRSYRKTRIRKLEAPLITLQTFKASFPTSKHSWNTELGVRALGGPYNEAMLEFQELKSPQLEPRQTPRTLSCL